ncbi:MAG: antibiotic biosynthesis monooxygenase [Sphingomicrobium sp.]
MTDSPPKSNAAILLAKFHLRPGTDEEFTAWQTRALSRAAGADGFVSSEVTPASALSPAWAVKLRFRDTPMLDSWRQSPDWQSLLDETQGLLAPKSAIETEVTETGPDGGVVEVIVTRVKPGKEAAYRDWETRIQQAQSKFPGYLGSYVQPPIAGELGWTTLMRFGSAEQLDSWLKSPERTALLKDAQPLIDYAHLQRVDSSFPGWFPTDPSTGKGPPNWKAAMLVLLGLFPIVMLEAKFLSPQLAFLNSSLGMFIGNVISVALTTWATMPLFIKAFGWWLFPKSDGSGANSNLLGTAVILGLFAAEVAALSHLL